MYTCTYACLYIGKWTRELLTKVDLKVPERSLCLLPLGRSRV